jgi:hypothetical protein
MNFRGKKRCFIKACLISFLMMVMVVLCLSAQVMANVQMSVVDISDNTIIEANPGEAVEIYIRLDNVEAYIDPDNPTIQSVQVMFIDVDSVLDIDYTYDSELDRNIPVVEAYGVTEGTETLEAWPAYAGFVDDIVDNPVISGLAMNPVDPEFFDPFWYTEQGDLEAPPTPWPHNAAGPNGEAIYYLPTSGNILKISATVKADAPVGDHDLCLSGLPDGNGGELAIINEGDITCDIVPSECSTLRVGGCPDTTPPVWDDTIGVQEVIPIPGGLKVIWGTATDDDSPPVTYNLYYREGSPVFTDPDTPHPDTIKLEDVTSPYTIMDLTEGVEYCIVVRAQDSPAPPCEPNEDDNIEELCGIPNPPELKKCFKMTIQPDLNMVSIPLDPGEPWTLEDLYNKVEADFMFYWDGSDFQYYGGGDTTIPAEGGVGYVAIRDISDPPIEVTFEGVAWSNISKPQLVSERTVQSETKTLEVTGRVFDENDQPVGAGYTVVITNINKPQFTETTETNPDGTYADALFDLFDPVAETGDVIQVVATTPEGTESAENTETYESGNSMMIDVHFPKTKYFKVVFEPDINVIGVPLYPEAPWTLKELLISIPANFMFYYDGSDFQYYGDDDTGIPVEGGVGYIAVCDPDINPVEHIYEGVAWENTTCPPAAPLMVSESTNVHHTSIFAVVGQIQQSHPGELDGLSLRLHNSRTKQKVSTKPAKDGSYNFVFFDLWNRDVIAAGDSLMVTIEDANRIYQNETFEIVTNVKDIQNHRVILKPIQLYTVPKKTKLLANYPNPFNPETWIPYQLSQDSHVTIRIYDLSGRLVRSLDLGHRSAGHYITPSKAVYWDGANQLGEHVASGVYFYTLQADRFVATRKLLIVK